MIAVPLVIQYGLRVTREFIIEEEIIEASLIVILFGISCFILRGFKCAIKDHECAMERLGEEKSKLVSRLADAFSYIGIVNVELQVIKSILCGVEHYPQTKKEFKRLNDHLAAKAMTVAGTPWVVIRMISRSNGRTIKECAIVRSKRGIPSVTMGNREILKNRHVKGFRKIGSRQKNLDLLTVCILPSKQLSKKETILITAIINQIEMLFMLYHSGFLQQQSFNDHNEKKTCHDTH